MALAQAKVQPALFTLPQDLGGLDRKRRQRRRDGAWVLLGSKGQRPVAGSAAWNSLMEGVTFFHAMFSIVKRFLRFFLFLVATFHGFHETAMGRRVPVLVRSMRNVSDCGKVSNHAKTGPLSASNGFGQHALITIHGDGGASRTREPGCFMGQLIYSHQAVPLPQIESLEHSFADGDRPSRLIHHPCQYPGSIWTLTSRGATRVSSLPDFIIDNSHHLMRPGFSHTDTGQPERWRVGSFQLWKRFPLWHRIRRVVCHRVRECGRPVCQIDRIDSRESPSSR